MQNKYTDDDIRKMLETTRTDELLFSNSHLTEQEVVPEPEERTALGTVWSSVKRGVDNTQGLGYAAGASIAHILGADGVRDWALDGYFKNLEEAEENKAEVGSYKNIKGVGDAGTYALETLGELAPTIATIILGGGIGGAAANYAGRKMVAGMVKKDIEKRVAAGIAKDVAEREAVKNVGRMVGAWQTAAQLEAGSMYGEDVEEFGVEGASPGRAQLLGQVSGATDIVFGVEGALLRSFAGKFGKGAAKKLDDALAKKLLKVAAGEGGQEMLQEAIAIGHNALGEIENFGGNLHDVVDRKGEQYKERMIEAGIKGAIGGAGMGVGVHGLDKMHEGRQIEANKAAAQEGVNKLTMHDDAQHAQQLEAEMQATQQQGAQQEDVSTPSAAEQVSGQRTGINGPGGATDATPQAQPGTVTPPSQPVDQQPTQNQQTTAPMSDGVTRGQTELDSIMAQPLSDGVRQQLVDRHEIAVNRLRTIGSELDPASKQQLMDEVNTLTYIVEGMGKVANGEPIARALQAGSPQEYQYQTPQQRQAEAETRSHAGAIDLNNQAAQTEHSARQIEAERQARHNRNQPVHPSQATDAYADEWAARQGVQQDTAQRRAGLDAQQQQVDPNDLGAEVETMRSRNTQFLARLDQKKKTGEDVNADDVAATLGEVKRISKDETVSDEEWLGILTEVESTLPSSSRMKEWLSVLDKARQRVQAEREVQMRHDAQSLATRALADTMGEAATQVRAERDADLRSRANTDPAAWREYRDKKRAKEGVNQDMVDAEFEASVAASVEQPRAPLVKPQQRAVKQTKDAVKQAQRVVKPQDTSDAQVKDNSDARAKVTEGTSEQVVDNKPSQSDLENAVSTIASQGVNKLTAVLDKIAAKKKADADKARQEAEKVEEVRAKLGLDSKEADTTPSVVSSKLVRHDAPGNTDSTHHVVTMSDGSLVKIYKSDPGGDNGLGAWYVFTHDYDLPNHGMDFLGFNKAEALEALPSKLKQLEKYRDRPKASKTKADDTTLPKRPTLYDDDDAVNTLTDPLSGYGSALDYDNTKADPVEETGGYINEDGDWVETKKPSDGRKYSTKKPISTGNAELDAKLDKTRENVGKREAKDPANIKKRTAGFEKRVKEVFGPKADYRKLKSGSMMVVTPNGAAILVRQQDALVTDMIGADGKPLEANGWWEDQATVLERHGIKLNRGGIMMLAKDRDAGTADHETMHAAMSLALTPLELKILRKRYMKDDMTEVDFDEAVAEAYQKWKPSERNGIFGKVHQFGGWLKETLFGYKPTDPDDVFKNVRKGKAWKQDGGTSRVKISSDGTRAEYDGRKFSMVEDGRTILESQAVNVLTQKLPRKGKPSQMLKVIEQLEKGGQIKAEELEWTGVKDWLRELPDNEPGFNGKQVISMVKYNTPKLFVEAAGRGGDSYYGWSSGMGKRSDYKELLITTPTTDGWHDPDNMPTHPLVAEKYQEKYKDTVKHEHNLRARLNDLTLPIYDIIAMPKDAMQVTIELMGGNDAKSRTWSFTYYGEGNSALSGEYIGDSIFMENLSDIMTLGGVKDDMLGGQRVSMSVDRLISHYLYTKGSEFDTDTRNRYAFEARLVGEYQEAVRRRRFMEIDMVEESAELSPNKSHGYQEGHWGRHDVVAHMRLSSFTDPEGKKTLVLEEVQSDFHQKMRENKNDIIERYVGTVMDALNISDPKEAHRLLTDQVKDVDPYYSSKTNEARKEAMNNHDRMVREAYNRENYSDGGDKASLLKSIVADVRYRILDMADDMRYNKPMRNSWHLLHLKYALDRAVKEGYEQVIIPKGEDQAARYPGMSNAEGLAKFYNTNLRNEYNKYLKKFGSKIENKSHKDGPELTKFSWKPRVEMPEGTMFVRVTSPDKRGFVVKFYKQEPPFDNFMQWAEDRGHDVGADDFFDRGGIAESIYSEFEIENDSLLMEKKYVNINEFKRDHPGMDPFSIRSIKETGEMEFEGDEYYDIQKTDEERDYGVGQVGPGSIENALTIPVTDKMREAISGKPQPLYSLKAGSNTQLYGSVYEDNPEHTELLGRALGPHKGGVLDRTVNTLKNLYQGDKESRQHFKESVFGILRGQTVDSFDRINVLGEMVDEVTGDNKGKLAYQTMRLSTTIDVAMSNMLQHGRLHFLIDDGDGVNKLTDESRGETNEGLIPLIEKLGDDLPNFLIHRVARRARKLHAEGRENNFTLEDINNLDEVAGDVSRFDEANEHFNKLQERIINYAIDSGTLSADAKEHLDIIDYLPFYRVRETAFGDDAAMVGFTNTNDIISGIKKLKGGRDALDDPLTNILKNWSMIVIQAAKNNARTRVVDVMKEFGNEVIQPVSLTQAMADRSAATINVMRDGKHEYYLVKDEALYDALITAPSVISDNAFMALGQKAKRWLTYGATFSPDFRVANFFRDTIQTSLLNKGYTPLDAIRGFKKAWNNHEDYIELRAHGGAFSHGFLYGTDPDNVHKYIEEVVVKDGKTNIVKHSAKKMLDWWSKVGDAAENANRVGLYSKLKQDGMAEMEAAYEAKDILDFSMRGGNQALQIATSLIPFLNARIAGLYKVRRGLLGKGLTDFKPEFYRTVGMLTSASLALAAWNASENEKEWDALQPHEKMGYYHIWAMGQHFRLPKPFEIGAIFSSLPEALMDAARKEDRKIIAEWFKHTTTNTFAVDWKAQVFKPALEIWANKDSFTGNDIIPMGMEYLAPEMQYKENTKSIAKVIGNTLGVAPVHVEHVIKGYTASLGIMAMTAADIALEYLVDPVAGTELADKKPLNTNNIWGVGRFVRDDSIATSRYVSDFYDYARRVDEVAYTARALQKDGDPKKLRDYIEENLELVQNKKLVNKLKKQFGNIRTRRLLINKSKTMTTERKAEELRKLVKMRNDLGRLFVEEMKRQSRYKDGRK